MMNFKLILFCNIVAIALFDSTYAIGRHRIVYTEHGFQIGVRSLYDYKLSKTPVIILAPRTAIKESRTFQTDGIARITMVSVEEIYGNGGSVSVVHGGPGETFVTLEFTAERGHGNEYYVELYVTNY